MPKIEYIEWSNPFKFEWGYDKYVKFRCFDRIAHYIDIPGLYIVVSTDA